MFFLNYVFVILEHFDSIYRFGYTFIDKSSVQILTWQLFKEFLNYKHVDFCFVFGNF